MDAKRPDGFEKFDALARKLVQVPPHELPVAPPSCHQMSAERRRELESLSDILLELHILQLRRHIKTLRRGIGYVSNKLIAQTMLREARQVQHERDSR